MPAQPQALGFDSTASITLTNGPTIKSGTATPEGAVTAPKGSVFLRTDGAAATTLYLKTTGTGNTGWTAVTSA